MSFMNNFLIPLIQVIFILGIFGFLAFVLIRAIYRTWRSSTRFFWKYSIRRKPYDESTVKWCLEAMEKQWNYYDVKKFLMLKGVPKKQLYETLWIFEKMQSEILNQNKHKGGNYVRQSKGTDSQNETGKLPSF